MDELDQITRVLLAHQVNDWSDCSCGCKSLLSDEDFALHVASVLLMSLPARDASSQEQPKLAQTDK